MNIEKRLNRLESASGDEGTPLVIFRVIIDEPTDQPNQASHLEGDGRREWQRLPDESQDTFMGRIAADLSKRDGAARVIMWHAME